MVPTAEAAAVSSTRNTHTHNMLGGERPWTVLREHTHDAHTANRGACTRCEQRVCDFTLRDISSLASGLGLGSRGQAVLRKFTTLAKTAANRHADAFKQHYYGRTYGWHKPIFL